MWLGICLPVMIVAAWAAQAWLAPLSCPHCLRFNAFSRRRTGLTFNDMDSDGLLIQRSEETLCKRCGRHYWITWDDFAGRSAIKELQRR